MIVRMKFEITAQKGHARAGKLMTAHGSATTPAFVVVGTSAAVKSLTPEEVKGAGIEIMLSNTYHLHHNPGAGVVAALGGLQQMSRWNAPMITDSGGFQVFSLAKVRKVTEEGVEFIEPKSGDKLLLTPELSMQIQFRLGADIIMAFDELIGLSGEDRGREKEALDRTNRWLERCVAEHKRLSVGIDDPPALYGIVQGGLDTELRRQSLEFVQSQPVSGIAIGGLSVGETRREMFEVLEFLAPLYDIQRPKHLLGVGHPLDLPFAIQQGMDTFDCVLPTRNARHGHAWVSGDKTLNLMNEVHINSTEVIDPDCDCRTCRAGYTRGYLRHLFKIGEMLAGRLVSVHNLRYLARLVENERAKIDS